MIAAIGQQLEPHGFVPRPVAPSVAGVEVLATLVRKTWNTNRGVAVLRLPAGQHPGPLSQQLKIPLGKALGYFPVFWGMGLQLVWLGADIGPLQPGLDGFVDKIDNQRSIIQSQFVVDLRQGTVAAARTWGQVVTGPFQDAIAAAIQRNL